MPIPLSQTSMRRRPPRRRQPTTTPPSLGVAHGVGDQIEQDAFEQDEVAADPGATRYDPQPQTVFARRGRERRLDPFEQMIDREFRDAGSEHASVELGDIQ